jgi:hypothetical protein
MHDKEAGLPLIELVDQVRVAFSYLVANGAPLRLALWAGPFFAPNPNETAVG